MGFSAAPRCVRIGLRRPYNRPTLAALSRVSNVAASLWRRARGAAPRTDHVPKVPLPTRDTASRALPALPGIAPRPEPLLESRITWIWGSPRSGSTWLLKLLSHPLAPDPELPLGFEPPRREPGTGSSRGFDSLPIDETFISNHLAPALADPRLVDGRWVPGTINNLLAAAKPAYAFSEEYAAEWMPAARDFALARIQAVIDRAREAKVPLADGHRVTIKETNGSHAADLVMSLMPSARLLLLIRDGRDVIDSLLAGYQPGAFFANNQGVAISTEQERERAIGWAARLWACNTDVTLRAIERHPSALTRILRYEDLLAQPTTELASLCQWSGTPRGQDEIERIVERHSFSRLPARTTGPLSRNRAATPGLWRENLSATELRRVDNICGPLLERFGYER